MKKSAMLRQLLAEGKTIVKPGVYDALSAKILEMVGFKALGISGYALSVSLLGKPDVGFTTMSEVVNVCRNIASAVHIPLIADADTGYGNAINVMRTTDEFIKAGAAGFHIEDQEFPKRCGHTGGKKIVPRAEMIGKIRAAAKVRDEMDKDFVIIARSDARGAVGGSLEELIARAKSYVEAGADMIFPEALLSEEELQVVKEAVGVPIHYNRSTGGISPLIPLSRLQELGIAMASDAVGSILAAGKGIWEYANGFHQEDIVFSGRFLQEIKKTPLGSFHEFAGFPLIREWEKEFLPAEEQMKYENTTGYKPQ